MGLNDRALARLVAARRVAQGAPWRVRRQARLGLVVPLGPTPSPAPEQSCVRRSAQRSCRTSAQRSSTDPRCGTSISQVHITRLDGRAGRREAGVKQHRGMLTEEQIWRTRWRVRVSPARSIVEVTTEQDVEHSLVVANSLLHLEKTSVDLVAAKPSDATGGRDSLATRIVVALADPRIECVGETRTAPPLLVTASSEVRAAVQDSRPLGSGDRASRLRGPDARGVPGVRWPPEVRPGASRARHSTSSCSREAPRSVDLFPHRLGLCPDHLGRPAAPGTPRPSDPQQPRRPGGSAPDELTGRLFLHVVRRCNP